MQAGISIDNVNHNVVCYATITCLQSHINYANKYGLRFNPDKTVCMTVGKNDFINRIWFLEGSCLKEVNNLLYLGVCLSNAKSVHAMTQIKAARRAFFALKSTGVFSSGSESVSVSYLFNTALIWTSVCVAK